MTTGSLADTLPARTAPEAAGARSLPLPHTLTPRGNPRLGPTARLADGHRFL